MDLSVDHRVKSFRLFPRRLEGVIERMGEQLGLPSRTGISLVLCSPRALSKLKQEHFGYREITDVIAFPTGFPGIEGLLGEIWIAPETVWKNGLRFHKGLNGEFLFVLAHGLLHLLGLDDDTPRLRAAMFRRQEELLRTLREEDRPLPLVIRRRGAIAPRSDPS